MINSTLTELDLHFNKIGDVGATYLSDALLINSTLTKLDLLLNVINNSGVTRLSDIA